MSTTRNLAAETADSYAASVRAACDAGVPFGYVNRENDETADDLPDLRSRLYDDEWDDDVHDADNLPGQWETATGWDYLSDTYGTTYRVTGRSADDYRSAVVMIAGGGPNVYIDTDAREVVVYWGSGPERRALPAAFIDGLDDACREAWEAGE